MGAKYSSDPDAEVVALSPATLMATSRFLCEICGKGFQREQNLQLHRREHNLPWKLKQRGSKEVVRKRVYTCPEASCVHHDPSRALGDFTRIKKHFFRKHGEKKWKCDKCSKRYAIQSDWKAHSKICSTGEYKCDCGTIFSRRDSFITHRAFCNALTVTEESSKAGGLIVMAAAAQGHHPLLFSPQPAHEVMQPHELTALQDHHQEVMQPPQQQVQHCNYAMKPEIPPWPAMPYDHMKPEIKQRVSNMQEEIIGRVDEKNEIIGRVDNKREIKGRAADKHKIMELILSQDPNDNRFTIVCITGADGLGKTTVASLVYCDETMCRSFEARAWLCLSEVCSYEELLRSVVVSLAGVSCGLIEQDELEEVLKEEFVGKKLLLVLDNLCENNIEVCRRLLPLLSMGDKGSAVMVTTSSNMVSGHLGAAHAYKLKPLMHDSFLILAKPNFIDYSPLGSIINKIPSEYLGFPMFAKVIRGILYSAFAQKWFDDALGSKLTEILSKPDYHLHHLLYLSYRHLHPNRQRCFLYCSMFPRDYTYNKEKLLRLWMSQGFIIPEKEKHESDNKDNCEHAFNELLHRSFFDYLPSSDVKEQKYIMHELSSHLAWSASCRSASGNKFFRAHDHELHCIPKDVHHLSIISKQCDSEIYFSSFTEFRDLSTFLLVHNSQLESTDSQFRVMDVKALDEFFCNVRCLKTLDLSHTDIKELPESIGYISSLCFLGLNNTNIRRLPNSVCNLFKLQTLELQNSAYLVELPTDIKNLTSLYHLDASKEDGAIYVPPGIGQLTNLRTLTTFTAGGVSWNCNVSELAYLNSLKGYLHISSLNNVENAEDARRACLAAKRLTKLSLEWCHSGEDVESDDRMPVAEKVLDALKPHYLLEELNIKGYYGLEFPSWITDYALSDLVSITLDNCYNCEKLPTLGVLPLLRCLFIQSLRGVRVISYEFCATGTITRTSFPKLEILKLREMYNLEYWYDVLDGDFPSLRSLSIERCPRLNSIPRFQSVSDMSVLSCSKLNLPCLQSLQTLKVSVKQRKCLALPSELHSLQMLEVTCCDHLCSVDGLIRLQSLKHLKFQACPRLNFFQDEPLPDTLATVDIHHNCYALRNWRPNGFEELSDVSEVRRKFVRRKCRDKGVDNA